MEQLQKNNNKTTLPTNISKSITAKNLEANNFAAIVASVGHNIESILHRPPICMLAKMDMKPKIEIFLAWEIGKLKKSLNLNDNLNLQEYQIPDIANQIVETYPVETIEDFILCFKRGAIGHYGQIYRLDAAVIHDWIRKYLEEKYSVVENEIAKIKDDDKQPLPDIDYERFKQNMNEKFHEGPRKYQRWKSQVKKFMVQNLEVHATSQEHAEAIVKKLIELGEIEIVKNDL